MSTMTGFAGVYPILYSFFRPDGRLDHAAMQLQVDRCIAAGAHGIAVLGNVTESGKLTQAERIELMQVVGEAAVGRVPYAVTVGEPSIESQKAFVRRAEAAGASWVILQPPPVKGVPEKELVRFFGAVADASSLPVAIQNNPVNMDVWLSNPSLIELHRSHPNVTLLKGEGPASWVQQLIEASGGSLGVFAGLAGIEHITNLRSGCVGLIPAPDCVDVQIRIHDLWREGTTEAQSQAELLHRAILPLIVFMTRNLQSHQLAVGKRFLARRLGLDEVHVRPPAVEPTPFQLEEVARLGALLGPLDGSSPERIQNLVQA
jgi:4-hydroxy-tetrahydrodipicolinate synthase